MEIEEITKKIAFNLIYHDSVTSLMVWWSHQFNKPFFHDDINAYTEEELLIEWNIHKILDDNTYRQECEKEYDTKITTDEEWLKKEMGMDYFNTFGSSKDVDIPEGITVEEEGFSDKFVR